MRLKRMVAGFGVLVLAMAWNTQLAVAQAPNAGDSFTNPLLDVGPDPWVVWWKGYYYYYLSSHSTQHSSLYLQHPHHKRSPNTCGLRD